MGHRDDRGIEGLLGGVRHGHDGDRAASPPRGRPAPALAIPDPYRYTIANLEAETGINARTIRYYVSQGLLPPAHGRGPSATYDLGHLLRLRAILLLKDRHLPLEEIKGKLGDLSDRDLESLLGVATRPPEDRWRRIELHPDVELHVRERDGQPDLALDRAAEELVAFARAVLDRLDAER